MTDCEKILKETDKRLDSGHITDNANQNDGASHEFSSDDETDLLLAVDLDSGVDLNPDDDDDDINDPELLQDYDVLQNDGPREDGIPCVTLKDKKQAFNEEDKAFSAVYDKLVNKMWSMHQRNQMDEYISEKRERYFDLRDHLGRSLPHMSVEQGNLPFSKYLLAAGFNPNIKEHCGATPLTIAVHNRSKEFCELLVTCGAAIRGPLFAGLPSPLEMAEKLQEAEIYEILNPDSSDIDGADIAFHDPDFQFEKPTGLISSKKQKDKNSSDSSCEANPDRSTKGFITGVVGDVGTCKSNRGVIERSSSLSWVGIIVGDLDMKGSFVESCFKAQAPGGFHHLVKVVMKRSKLNEDAFKSTKYEKDNLRWIKEVVRDCGKSYCFEAAYEFKRSPFSPSTNLLRSCFCRDGNHNEIMISSLKKFLEFHSDKSYAFKYRSRMFMHHAPY